MTDNVAVLGKHGELDEALTAAYLREQRWFGAQTRDVSAVNLIDASGKQRTDAEGQNVA